MSELKYNTNFSTQLTNAGITPESNPVSIDGVIKQILANIVTAALPAVLNAAALPAADPHVAGRLWVNAGVVTRSAG